MRNIVVKLDGVEKASNEKLAIRFIAIRDGGIISWTTRSAFVFDSETDAIAGGERALVMLNASGMFPNMCELF